jgi:hypothetical protein
VGPGDHLFDLVLLTLDADLDRAIGPIPDPTCKPEALGLALGRSAKIDALYTTSNHQLSLLERHPKRFRAVVEDRVKKCKERCASARSYRSKRPSEKRWTRAKEPRTVELCLLVRPKR